MNPFLLERRGGGWGFGGGSIIAIFCQSYYYNYELIFKELLSTTEISYHVC